MISYKNTLVKREPSKLNHPGFHLKGIEISSAPSINVSLSIPKTMVEWLDLIQIVTFVSTI